MRQLGISIEARNPLERFLIVLIASIAFVLRAIQARSGLPYIHNWDEPQIAAHAIGILKTGDWNPHFFSYGSLLIYIDALVDSVNYLRLAALPTTYPESTMSLFPVKDISRIIAPLDPGQGWYWEVSHPSFYLWDRYVTALFGTLTVVATYVLALEIMPRRWAWLPALTLAILPIHIEHSAYATSDAPVAFLVVVVVLGAIEFAERGKLVALATSLIFVGLAAATKYNSALVGICPVIALAIRTITSRDRKYSWHWLLPIALPPIAFLVVMPYALLDFKTFITDLALDVTSYHSTGPAAATPGLQHFSLIFVQFEEQLGISVSAITLIGVLASLYNIRRDWRALFLLIFPAIFIIYMSGTMPDHHRNFIQIYPFIVIFFGLGMSTISSILALAARRMRWRHPGWVVPSATALLATVFLSPSAYSATSRAWSVLHGAETRTLSIRKLVQLADRKDVVIADVLRIHRIDLASLPARFAEEPTAQIVSELCSAPPPGHDYILPAAIKYSDFYPASDEQAAAVDRLNARLAALRQSPGVTAIGGDTPTLTTGPTTDPGILLVTRRPESCDKTGNIQTP